MKSKLIVRYRSYLIWFAFLLAVAAPIAGSITSPLLAWREPVYVAGGFFGVISLSLLLAQPMLAAAYLPGLSFWQSKRLHRWVGGALIISAMLHVAALWLTSPPDVVDALLFSSPTPFSVWGVIAMWGIFAAAFVVIMGKKLKPQPRWWRRLHKALASIVIVCTVIHAMLIEGTMEMISKTLLCIILIVVTLKALRDLKAKNL